MAKKFEPEPIRFDVLLSFAQELRERDINNTLNIKDPLVLFEPASNTVADPEVVGKAKLEFSPDFSFLDVKLQVRGNLTGDRKVTLAHFHLDQADKTGPLTVSLYPNSKAIVKVEKTKFSLKIRITNDDIISRHSENYNTNTVNSLYSAIRGDSLYIDAHGGGEYLLGMIRGQIYLPCK